MQPAADSRQAPYARLSAYYFFHFAVLGVFLPYWPLYLDGIGLSPSAIGMLVAVLLVMKMTAPYFWAWLADRRQQPMEVVRVTTALTAVAFCGVYLGEGFWWLAAVSVAYAFFWHAALPQVEVTTLNHLGTERARYGRVRLWGSLGFIVLVGALGPATDRAGVAVILPVISGLLVAVWLVAMWLPRAPRPQRAQARASIRPALAKPAVLALLGACLLMQASHAPYYTFFTIYLSELGYSGSVTGMLWAFGVICEVGVFLAMHAVFARVTAERVLTLTLVVAALRWVLTGLFAEVTALLVVAQAMHAVTFGAYHAAAIQLVYRHFPGGLQNRGQALYGSVSFGVGGTLGSYASGLAWEGLGATPTFLAAAGAAALAALITVAVPAGDSRANGND